MVGGNDATEGGIGIGREVVRVAGNRVCSPAPATAVTVPAALSFAVFRLVIFFFPSFLPLATSWQRGAPQTADAVEADFECLMSHCSVISMFTLFLAEIE